MTARIALLITAIVLAGPWSATTWTERVFASAREPRAGAPMIRIIPRHGPARIETLDGIGCSEAICSRVFVRTLASKERGTSARNIRFDAVAAIEMLGGGDARVRFIDGTIRRVLVAADNRVLYLVDEAGRATRLDLSDVVSIEFLPRTPWGDPDLQGVWSGAGLLGVPMEREPAFGTRNVVTDEEFQARLARLLEGALQNGIESTNFGIDLDVRGATSHQASLVVDPVNGRRPPRTPAAESRPRLRNSFTGGVFDSVADLGVFDRCLAFGTVPAALTVNELEIVQAPGFVAIRTELIHDTRVIPLDGRPHLGERLMSYAGDSRGRWEGSTLVVETVHVNGKAHLTGGGGERPSTQTTIIERYSLSDRDELSYEATIDDPATWIRPWTLAFPRTRDERHPVYEYACHEGNYGLEYILRASRAAEAGTSR